MPSSVAPATFVLSDITTTLQNASVIVGNGTILSLSTMDVEIMLTTVGASAVLATTFEVSFDSGSNYENAFTEDLLAAGGIATLINALTNPTTHRHRYRIPTGATNFRNRVVSRVSGSVTSIATVRGWR